MISRFSVQKLHCSACAARIEEALASCTGVESARIDLDQALLVVRGECPPLVEMNRLADRIEPGTFFEPYEAPVGGAPAVVEPPALWTGETIRLAISAVLFGIGMLFGDRLADVSVWGVLLVCYLVPYMLCGLPVLLAAGKSLRQGNFCNEFTLMSGATLAAAWLGEYPEAVGVMLFYALGEEVQERAAGRSRRSIQALLAARPSVAHVLDEAGELSDVDPLQLQPGAHILVRPGEKIPLDGLVLAGNSQVDTAPLTGESVPVQVREKDKVLAGTLNLDGALTVVVTAPYAESSMARILELVEQAVANKAPTERFITRFARWYTPVVFLFALLVAVLPPLFGLGGWHDWIYRALVLLVISCPCALLISIPLGYFGGIGAASRHGILVKGGYVFDALRRISTVAFDKTGTLTQAVFEVVEKAPVPGVTPEELLRVAAGVEQHSAHPLARAVLRAAEQAGLSVTPQTEGGTLVVHELPGHGLVAEEPGVTTLVGNARLLTLHSVPLPPSPNHPGSFVYVARAGQPLGVLAVSDVLRPEAASAVEDLRRFGVKNLWMLTGDREESAAPVAQLLQLTGYRAGLLPEGKAEALQSLDSLERILFVGDGLNDAPVLAQAGVGVAMGGGGSEAAVEIADVVILDDSPSRVPVLLRIAARTRAIVWQNIVLALGIKGLFMGLGIFGLSGLWEAVFADVGVALLAVLNATRAAGVEKKNPVAREQTKK